MALTTLGTAHVYGISGTIANAAVQSFSIKKDFQNRSSTLDESGNEIERRMDDTIAEGSITIRFTSAYTEPVPGATLSYDTVTYEIVSVDLAETNNGHAQYTLSIKTTENVSLA